MTGPMFEQQSAPGSTADELPIAARIGGYGGLLPFAGCAALAWWSPMALAALQAYGVVILSFVGAVHWGRALAGPAPSSVDGLIGWSVVPALLAWPLALLPVVAALPLLALAFALWRVFEFRYCDRSLPRWYARLRTELTAGAVVALLVGTLAAQ